MCFEDGNAWSSLEQVKNAQRFLVERVAKFTSLCLEQGQGFVESAKPPYPISCRVPTPHPHPPRAPTQYPATSRHDVVSQNSRHYHPECRLSLTPQSSHQVNRPAVEARSQRLEPHSAASCHSIISRGIGFQERELGRSGKASVLYARLREVWSSLRARTQKGDQGMVVTSLYEQINWSVDPGDSGKKRSAKLLKFLLEKPGSLGVRIAGVFPGIRTFVFVSAFLFKRLQIPLIAWDFQRENRSYKRERDPDGFYSRDQFMSCVFKVKNQTLTFDQAEKVALFVVWRWV